MVNNVSTNPGALVALQNLNRVSDQLAEVQRRVSTGKQVSSARDNPAIYALAQKQRAELGTIEPIQQALRSGISAVDVAVAAAESISDILVEMKAIASQASDTSLSDSEIDVLEQQYVAFRQQIERLVDNASIGGRNLLASGAADLTVIASTDGTDTITVAAQDFSSTGGLLTISFSDTPFAAVADDPATAGVDESRTRQQSAQAELAAITASIDNSSLALASLGAGSKTLELQGSLFSRISDALEISIGNLVDADLAKESSRLQALQVQQQLAIQTLSIANAAPNAILALFA